MHATCNEQEERWRAGCMNRESIKTMSRNERQQQSVGAFVRFTSRQTTSQCCEQITTLVEFQVIKTAEGLGLIYLSCRKSSHTGYTFDLCDRCLLCGRCHFRQHFRSGMKLVYQLSSGTIHVLGTRWVTQIFASGPCTCQQGLRCLACQSKTCHGSCSGLTLPGGGKPKRYKNTKREKGDSFDSAF
mgnify:CR=1 FL=1